MEIVDKSYCVIILSRILPVTFFSKVKKRFSIRLLTVMFCRTPRIILRCTGMAWSWKLLFFNCSDLGHIYISQQIKTLITFNYCSVFWQIFDANFLILPSLNFTCDHVRSHKKFGLVRFSRFDDYLLQTNKHTPRHANSRILLLKLSW